MCPGTASTTQRLIARQVRSSKNLILTIKRFDKSAVFKLLQQAVVDELFERYGAKLVFGIKIQNGLHRIFPHVGNFFKNVCVRLIGRSHDISAETLMRFAIEAMMSSGLSCASLMLSTYARRRLSAVSRRFWRKPRCTSMAPCVAHKRLDWYCAASMNDLGVETVFFKHPRIFHQPRVALVTATAS